MNGVHFSFICGECPMIPTWGQNCCFVRFSKSTSANVSFLIDQLVMIVRLHPAPLPFAHMILFTLPEVGLDNEERERLAPCSYPWCDL